MRPVTRRDFIGGAAAVAAISSTKFSFGMPLGLMPGIQLYSVREQMAQDFEGTLAAVREAGYLEVEVCFAAEEARGGDPQGARPGGAEVRQLAPLVYRCHQRPGRHNRI